MFPKIKEIRQRNRRFVAAVQQLTDPYIFLNDNMVDVCGIDFFDPGLDQGIVVHLDGKGKGFTFPVAICIIVEVFGILVTRQRIVTAAPIEMVSRVLWRVFVVPQKREMGVVDNFDHPEIAGVWNRILSGDCHTGHELPGAVQADPSGIGMGAGVDGQAGGEKDKS